MSISWLYEEIREANWDYLEQAKLHARWAKYYTCNTCFEVFTDEREFDKHCSQHEILEPQLLINGRWVADTIILNSKPESFKLLATKRLSYKTKDSSFQELSEDTLKALLNVEPGDDSSWNPYIELELQGEGLQSAKKLKIKRNYQSTELVQLICAGFRQLLCKENWDTSEVVSVSDYLMTRYKLRYSSEEDLVSGLADFLIGSRMRESDNQEKSRIGMEKLERSYAVLNSYDAPFPNLISGIISLKLNYFDFDLLSGCEALDRARLLFLRLSSHASESSSRILEPGSAPVRDFGEKSILDSLIDSNTSRIIDFVSRFYSGRDQDTLLAEVTSFSNDSNGSSQDILKANALGFLISTHLMHQDSKQAFLDNLIHDQQFKFINEVFINGQIRE